MARRRSKPCQALPIARPRGKQSWPLCFCGWSPEQDTVSGQLDSRFLDLLSRRAVHSSGVSSTMSPGLGVTFKLTTSSHPTSASSRPAGSRLSVSRGPAAPAPLGLSPLQALSSLSAQQSLCCVESLLCQSGHARAHPPLSYPSPRLRHSTSKTPALAKHSPHPDLGRRKDANRQHYESEEAHGSPGKPLGQCAQRHRWDG